MAFPTPSTSFGMQSSTPAFTPQPVQKTQPKIVAGPLSPGGSLFGALIPNQDKAALGLRANAPGASSSATSNKIAPAYSAPQSAQAKPVADRIASTPGQTPQQMAAAAGGATTGAGSADPTASKAGAGTPAQGYLGQLIDQAKTYEAMQAPLTAQSQQIASDFAKQEADIGNRFTGLDAADASARVQQLENFKNNAISQIEQEQAKLAGYQQPITQALGAGVTAATSYQNAPYGQPMYNPLTGEYTMAGGAVGGGTGAPAGTQGGSLNPQDQAATLAQEVQSGGRTYQDAVNQMETLVPGGAGLSMLNNALGPGFNYAQASALGTTQGQVNPALNQAQQALNNLTSVMGSIPGWQATGIPVLNSLTGLLSKIGIGTGTQTEKQNAINEARTNVANALGTVTNTTPSAWTSMVEQWFPDNATPDQINAGISQFNTLAQYRSSIYSSPGKDQPFTPDQAQSLLNNQSSNASGSASTGSGYAANTW